MINNEEIKREYYFTNEDHPYIKTVNLVTGIVCGNVLIDFLVCLIVLPAIMVGMGGADIFAMNGSSYIRYMIILAGYLVVEIILGCLIDKLGHRKVFVREGNTFYIIGSSIAIDNHTKLSPSGGDNPPGYVDPYDIFKGDTDAYIHSRYKDAIETFDKKIDKKRKNVKVLTSCIEEGASPKGIKYSGFNNETMETEEFVLPSYFLKYDKNRKYYKPAFDEKLKVWIFKIPIYLIFLIILCSVGINNKNKENQCVQEFIQTKADVFSTYGFEFNNYAYKHFREVKFWDKNCRTNTIEYTYIIDDDYSKFSTDWIQIDYEVRYDADTETVYNLINTALDGDFIDKSILDSRIEKLKETGIEEGTKYYYGKNGCIYLTVRKSDEFSCDLSVWQKID